MPQPPPIERAFLRDADDGTTVFFPWGLGHRGYRLDGSRARQKASRAASTLMGSVVAIGTWTAYALQPLLESEPSDPAEVLRSLAAPGAALCLVVLGYALWASRFVEGLAESDVRVSREERLREAAELAGPGKVALLGLVACGAGALLVAVQPRAWWLGLLTLALGVGALFWSHLLRRASARPRA